jgi:hypothetical protein
MLANDPAAKTSEPCRCAGTGTYTTVITLADAVLLDDHACPAGCPPAPADHQRTESEREATL